MNVFWVWFVGHYHLNLLPSIFWKQILYPSPLKNWFLLTQLLMFRFKSPLLKPKPKIKFNEILFEFLNIHNNYLTQLGMINITSKCQNKNIFWNNLKFIILFNMIFGSFECVCAQICNYINVVYVEKKWKT